MEIRTEKKDGIFYIAPVGNINSSNAAELEAVVKSIETVENGIIFDFKDLEYISSAGLRVILAAKKKCGQKTFSVINVSVDVMSIFDVTGFSDIMEIVPAKRQISVEGCKRIGAGACGECFRIDDETIIKLYYSHISNDEIEREKALAKKAFVMGVPTAISYDIVECDGRIGVVYELIKSKTVSELIRENPDNMEKYIDMYVKVCKSIHEIEGEDEDLPVFKEIDRESIKKIFGISDEERNLLHKFLDIVPEKFNCIHGDLNINNIMVQGDECCLIDMGEFSTGTPMFDISRIIFSMKYANTPSGEMNTFYKLPSDTITYIYTEFMKRYFGCDSLEEAESSDKWLMPLAWFRCCTAMIRENRWPVEYKEMAEGLLREKLIPFIKENL